MSTIHLSETNTNEEGLSSRDEQRQRHPSTNSSTPNSSGGDKHFHYNERSGQNSRTSSLAESTVASTTSVNNEGFSNIGDIVQHLQTVWLEHHNQDGPRRTGSTSTANTNVNESVSSHYSKTHSQGHYSHHPSGQQHNQYSGQQHWNNYNNPRRTGGGNYNRNYSGGNNDLHWNSKSNRFPSHRSMNNLMSNSVNYQQQSQASPPTQRRQGDQQQYYHNEQSSQSYYKKNRSDHDRRSNGYNNQQSSSSAAAAVAAPVDYSASNSTSEQSNISSTQSYPSNLNAYNR